MRKLILDILVVNMMIGVVAFALASPSSAQYVSTEIIDATGDGSGNALDRAHRVAVDSSDNVYVTGIVSDNAFKIRAGLRVPALSNRGLAALAASLMCAALWLARRQRLARA
jgi:hypothetical protein